MKVINIKDKFTKFSKNWHPHQIALVDDMQVILAKLKGEFVWHQHDDTDEAFVVLEGNLRIEYEDGSVELGPGEMVVVPKGVVHKPIAKSECKLLLIEPKGVVNTGDQNSSEKTAKNDVWI